MAVFAFSLSGDTSTTFDADGWALRMRPSMVTMGLSITCPLPGFNLFVVVLGANKLRLILSADNGDPCVWSDEADIEENWFVLGEGEPTVARIVRVNDATLDIYTDTTLYAKKVYSIVSSVEFALSGYTLSLADIYATGVKIWYSQTQGIRNALVDISRPIAKKGQLVNSFDVDSTGDYALSDGLESLRQLIWAILLTEKGRFFWAPNVGLPLKLKSPMPARLDKEGARISAVLLQIPQVKAARVRITKLAAGNAVYVDVNVRTLYGEIHEARTLEG